ncbi:MAG: hypothetical protein O2822_00075, partial [Chloroflexi bacterium]|nr:hypothetical protein [Chloroflexota bacterium]
VPTHKDRLGGLSKLSVKPEQAQSSRAALERRAAFPVTSVPNPRYYLGDADDGKWHYAVVLLRTGEHTYVAGQGGVALSPRHPTLQDDLVCWAGDPCTRGGDHGWTQVSDEPTTMPNVPSEVFAEIEAGLDRYIERWKRRLFFVTDGGIFQDGRKVG